MSNGPAAFEGKIRLGPSLNKSVSVPKTLTPTITALEQGKDSFNYRD